MGLRLTTILRRLVREVHPNVTAEPGLNSPISDPRSVTFSQAQGVERLPGRLAPGELSRHVRIRLWSTFFTTIVEHRRYDPKRGYSIINEGPWYSVLLDLHVRFFGRPADEYSLPAGETERIYKPLILNEPYNRVFDLLQFAIRHPECPSEFVHGIRATFEECQMAYVVDVNGPPTIFPASTRHEGDAILQAREDLRESKQSAANCHLQRAGELLNNGHWSESVHESSSALESVARHLIGDGKATLSDALKHLKHSDEWGIHPAIRVALEKLYAYASDAQGVRHAATDTDRPVRQAEAQLLMVSCAAACSYLLTVARLAQDERP